mmetsp:Transcript_15840/g.20687  ORF Transcript_15840/g.20687 Transcript_15840/m.20687 type:complete len:205 (-) Transcript_15840:596-1210(-)
MVAIDESIPLFLLSRQGGIGLSAKAIGTVLSASGLLCIVSQSLFYVKVVRVFGLSGSIKLSFITTGPFIVAVPLVLCLKGKSSIVRVDGLDYQDLAWIALVYLTLLIAIHQISGFAASSSLLVALNRTVIPEHRSAINNFNNFGGSILKVLGPSFAGALVAFSFSSGLFDPFFGAVFTFVLLAALGGLNAMASIILLKEVDGNA